MATTSTDLVPLAQVREAVISGFVPDVIDPEEIAREFAERLLRAQTPEELFSVTEAVSAQDMLGEPFTLTDARFLRSDYLEEGSGFSVYALLHAVNSDGEPFAVTCGGRNVVVQCLRALEEGWLPRKVRFEEAGKAKQGRNRPLYLVIDA